MVSKRKKTTKTIDQASDAVKLNEFFKAVSWLEPVQEALKIFIGEQRTPVHYPTIRFSFEIPPVARHCGFQDADFSGSNQLNLPKKQLKEQGCLFFEDWLGVYDPLREEVTLYVRGIAPLVELVDAPLDLLIQIALVHLIGHWITHALPFNQSKAWTAYPRASFKVKEGWAQLIAYKVANQIGGDYKKAFNALDNLLSDPYHTYRRFIDRESNAMTAMLEEMRASLSPVSLGE